MRKFFFGSSKLEMQSDRGMLVMPLTIQMCPTNSTSASHSKSLTRRVISISELWLPLRTNQPFLLQFIFLFE